MAASEAFLESQFRYCFLTWIFHSRKSNNEINLFHETTLRIIYNDRIPSLQELLDRDNSFTVHHFSVQSLAIEMFKVINNIAANIIDDLFTTYHLRSSFLFQLCVQFITVKFLYNITTLNMIPSYIKYFDTLDKFKGKMQKWKPMNCACHLCKEYIPNYLVLVAHNLNVKGYFTLLVDATKMYLGFNRVVCINGSSSKLFSSFLIFLMPFFFFTKN